MKTVAALAWVLLLVSACGGGGSTVCGNGVSEPGEDCDDGNTNDGDLCTNACRFPGGRAATVIWEPLLATEHPGFNETCGGVRADDIEIRFDGPASFVRKVECGNGQMLFRGLPDGEYTVTGTLFRTNFNTDESAAITDPVSATLVLAGQDREVRLDFRMTDFHETYTGTFFFRVLWGGVDMCAAATPPVVDTTIRMERGGSPMMGKDRDNNPVLLDGQTPYACKDAAEQFPQSFKEITWGPARIIIAGRDDSGVEQFRGSFDTFVGAGVGNPEMSFDVPSLAPDAAPTPDGGPDGGMDAP